MFIVMGFACLIIFFPLNGTISRYLLFGTYLMILHALFENYNHRSIILIIAFLGFYYVFPAFNFFKNGIMINPNIVAPIKPNIKANNDLVNVNIIPLLF